MERILRELEAAFQALKERAESCEEVGLGAKKRGIDELKEGQVTERPAKKVKLGTSLAEETDLT